MLTWCEQQNVTVRPTEGGRFSVVYGPDRRRGLVALSGRCGESLTLDELVDWLDDEADAAAHLAACPTCTTPDDELHCTEHAPGGALWVGGADNQATLPTTAGYVFSPELVAA